MSASGIAALFFTVALLVTTAYFIMGGLPLLVLQHDTPLDQKFIRRFFAIYYKAALLASGLATVSYAMWGRLAFALGTAIIAVFILLLRRKILPLMEELGTKIQASDETAIQAFRRVHGIALAVNLLQLVALVWGVTQISL